MRRKIFNNQRGQTSVEYLLLIVVGISLGLTFLKKMNEWVLDNPDGLIGRPLNEFRSKLSQDPTGRYQYYPLGPRLR